MKPNGRVPGQRGLATRDRLLDETRAMLVDTSFRDLRVVDIARAAGTSPATFYQYFSDAEDALFTLAEELAAEGRGRLAKPVLEGDWSREGSYGTCLAIASTFLEFWEDHGSLLAVIDLVALEGQLRFRKIRTSVLNPFTEAVESVVSDQRRSGRLPPDADPQATVAVLVAMLAHVSAHRYGIEAYGASAGSIRDAMARVLHSALSGSLPPG